MFTYSCLWLWVTVDAYECLMLSVYVYECLDMPLHCRMGIYPESSAS